MSPPPAAAPAAPITAPAGDERRSTAALRREADRRLAAVVEGMSDAFLSLDAEWRVTYANRECARLNGTTARALVGQDHWARWPEAVGSEVERQYRRAAAEGVAVRFTHHYPGADVWHAIHVYPADGGGLAVFYRDVTAEQRAEAERERLLVAERAARLRVERLQGLTAALAAATTEAEVCAAILREGHGAVGAAATAVALVVPPGEPREPDHRALTLELAAHTGWPEAAVTAWARFPGSLPDGRPLPPERNSPIADAIRHGEPVWLEGRDAAARRYPVLEPLLDLMALHAWLAVPFAIGEGADRRVLGGLISVLRDRSAVAPEDRALLEAMGRQCAQALERARLVDAERAVAAERETLYGLERQARAAAEDAYREASAASRAKGDFLAVMSHELRTPLNAIAGHVELVLMGLHGPVTPEQHRALDRVQHAQRHLLGLITDALDYARLEAGRVQYEMGEVELADVLEAASALVEPQRLAKGQRWGVELPEGGCRVWADREKLGRVLVNLLANAVKFTPAGGAVTARVLAPPSRPDVAVIEVADTGIGIPADQRERVFEPFVQVRTGLTRPAAGTGLGLAISRDLVRGMGGELSLDSVPGEGSTFRVRVRRAGAGGPAGAAPGRRR